MESNKKNNSNGEDEYQQLRRSARKRKLNELSNDDDDHGQPAAEKEEQQQPTEKCRKNEHGQKPNDSEDLQLEGLSRKDLIKLVKKKVTEAKESAKQAQEFSQRIVQLDQEKAELNEGLNKKSAQIVEMHKEMEEKSRMIAEKTEECNALVIQLNDSRREQIVLPADQEMKIQLSLETWYDWLAFVPRYHLGKIVPKIGDRKFASIVQKFLHEYHSEIALKNFDIVPPYEQHPNDSGPRVRVWQNGRKVRVKMAEAPMPANITSFGILEFSYFDQSVLEFMRKFQQNSLLNNVRLVIDDELKKDIVQPVLTHLLPLINGILSVAFSDSAQLVDIYDNAGNSKEIYELNMEMMEKTRFLGDSYYDNNLEPNIIDLYCRWLYQTPRKDGKPRVLFFGRAPDSPPAPISPFLDRIKQDFLAATHPIAFFIRIKLPKASFHPEEEHIFILRNDQTNEKLVTTMEEALQPDPDNEDDWEQVALLVSRYPLESTKKWIEGNKKEVLDWDFAELNNIIAMEDEEFKTINI